MKEKLVEENANRKTKVESTDFMLDEQILNGKILDLNSTDALEEFNEIKVTKSNAQLYKTVEIDESMLWHIRLGYPNLNYLKELKKSNELLKNVKFDDNILLDCENCILTKMEKLPFKESRLIAEKLLHTIHIDTMGQFKIVPFPGENKYIIVFIDDFSRLA